MRCFVTVSLVCSLLALAACSSRVLTRGKAKDIVQEANFCKVGGGCSIGLSPREFQALLAAGYFHVNQQQSVQSILFGQQVEITQKGKPFFASASVVPRSGEGPTVVPAVDLKAEVEITGIGDGANDSEKIVEYKWKFDYSSMADEISIILKDHEMNDSTIKLRLYDDGWRVEPR